MLKVLMGKTGVGKTKVVIQMANESAETAKGNVAFIDDDNRYMFDLRHEIRFINAGEYGVKSPEIFYGFTCGLLAQNFDIDLVYVDAFLKLVREDVSTLNWMFEQLEAVANKHNVRFVISCNGDQGAAPGFLQQYLI